MKGGMRTERSREAGRIKSGSSSRVSKRSESQFQFNLRSSQSPGSSSTEPFFTTTLQELNSVLHSISAALFELNLNNPHFDALYQEYGRLAAKIMAKGCQSITTGSVEMSQTLLKEVRKEEKRRIKLENDLDNLFEGARVSICEKEEVIKMLEERLKSLDGEMLGRDRKIKEQAETIEFLKSKIDREEAPIDKYLPPITLTEPKSPKTHTLTSRSESNQKPPLPQNLKSHHPRLSPDPSPFHSDLSSDLIRMLLLQSLSLQAKLQHQSDSLI